MLDLVVIGALGIVVALFAVSLVARKPQAKPELLARTSGQLDRIAHARNEEQKWRAELCRKRIS